MKSLEIWSDKTSKLPFRKFKKLILPRITLDVSNIKNYGFEVDQIVIALHVIGQLLHICTWA